MSAAASLVNWTVLVDTVAVTITSLKVKFTALSQSDWRTAPLVGKTVSRRGGWRSAMTKVRVTTIELLALSVARTAAVRDAPFCGRPVSDTVKLFVTGWPGISGTATVWV